MANFTILAGGYTSFVATYLFNSNAGSLSLLSQSPTGPSVSWISRHPTNSSILYATNEVTTGELQSFTVFPNGSLSAVVDQVSTGGNGPVFAGILSTGQVATPNYGDGTAQITPTTGDLMHFAKNATPIVFPPPAGGVSHPHMMLPYKQEVFVSDLGADKVWRLAENGAPGKWAIQGFIPQAKGSGPRHMAIYDDELYVLHELDSTLTVQAIPTAPNCISPVLANVTITPPNPPSGAYFAAGEILIPPPTINFPTPYIYVSNRNTGTQDPRGDTIVIYERTSAGLTLVTQAYTGLDQIRGMEFGSGLNGGEAYLAAAGSAGTAGVMVFKRVDGGRGLQMVAKNSVIPTRTSFAWL